MKNKNQEIQTKSKSQGRKESENDNGGFLQKTVLRFKVILIGDAAVGKTSLLQRFIHNRFTTEYNCTIGVDYWVKSLQLDNQQTVDLQIWDTCGQERFKTITRQYYRDTQGCILVFDLTKRESFRNIEMWVEDIKNFSSEEMTLIIVGNKCDIVESRAVSKEEIDRFMNNYSYKYFEVSALTGENVKLCFETISKQMFVQNENLQNLSLSKKKFKVDTSNVKMNKSVKLNESINSNVKNTKCC